MNNLEPQGVGRRALSALALLGAIAYGAHLIVSWLMPIVPLIISGVVVLRMLATVFRRRG